MTNLPVLSLISVCSLARTADILCQTAARSANGNSNVEDQGALIQKTAMATSGQDIGSDVGLDVDAEGGVEFNVTEAELPNAALLIPQKLKAAGLAVHDFEDGLIVYTAGGSLLQAEPSKGDFPLRIRYEARMKPRPDARDYNTTQMEVDMAYLAEGTYDFSVPDPKCWKREIEGKMESWFKGWDLDHFSLHTCQCGYCKVPLEPAKEVCAIAIAGSNDGNDWMNNARIFSQGAFCGRRDYHAGFAAEARDISNSPEFEPFAEKLKVCGRIIFTGHSLGAAVASMFARCVNCEKKCGKQPPAFRNISVEAELYTIGAPGITKTTPMKNDRAKDGVFKGARFWNYARRCFFIFGCYDPVPWTMANSVKDPYLHPKVKSVALGQLGGTMVWNGDNAEAIYEPKNFMLTRWAEHSSVKYVNRLQMHRMD